MPEVTDPDGPILLDHTGSIVVLQCPCCTITILCSGTIERHCWQTPTWSGRYVCSQFDLVWCRRLTKHWRVLSYYRTRDIEPMLTQCWADVAEHWYNVSCLLAALLCLMLGFINTGLQTENKRPQIPK